MKTMWQRGPVVLIRPKYNVHAAYKHSSLQEHFCTWNPGSVVEDDPVWLWSEQSQKINPAVPTAVTTIIHPFPDSIKQLFIISGHNLYAFVPVPQRRGPSAARLAFNCILRHSCGNTARLGVQKQRGTRLNTFTPPHPSLMSSSQLQAHDPK